MLTQVYWLNTEEDLVSEIIDMFVFETPCTFSLKFLSHYETIFFIFTGTPFKIV